MHFILIVLIFFSLYWLQQKIASRRKRLPPGPLRLPGIGCALQILLADFKFPPLAFHKLGKKYGDVLSIQTGTEFYVIVNGYEAIREVESNDDIMNRATFDWILDRTYGKKLGLIFSESRFWSETRLYTMRTLNDFGFGKTFAMETIIKEELQEFVTYFKERVDATNDGIVNMDGIFSSLFVNIIWCLIIGERFSYHDPKLQQLIDLVHDVTITGKFGGGLLGSYPFLQTYAPNWSGFTQQHEANLAIRQYFEDLIDRTQRKGDYKSDPTNFIEIFLNCIDSFDPLNTDKKGTVDPKNFYISNSRRRSSVISIFNTKENIFTKQNLVAIIYDLFMAGSETSSNVLSFAIVHLIRNQRVQDKIRIEIDKIVGCDRLITANDRRQMPYTEAVVLETLRISTTLPIIPRQTTCRTNIGKYTIQPNTMVLVNLYSSNMDKGTWGDPETFRPERFLNSTEEQLINQEKMVSFGSGRRNCMAEGIAKLSIFLALANLIQNFKFDMDPTKGAPSTEIHLGLTGSPLPYTTLVRSR